MMKFVFFIIVTAVTFPLIYRITVGHWPWYDYFSSENIAKAVRKLNEEKEKEDDGV